MSNLVFSVDALVCVGVERGQPSPAGDQEHAGGAAGQQQDPVGQTASPGEGEPAAQIQAP